MRYGNVLAVLHNICMNVPLYEKKINRLQFNQVLKMYVFDNFCGKFGGGRQAREERGGDARSRSTNKDKLELAEQELFRGLFRKGCIFCCKNFVGRHPLLN